ncbi:MAG: hypothetical protein AAFY04_01260 [Pseudomonadota bacterium]
MIPSCLAMVEGHMLNFIQENLAFILGTGGVGGILGGLIGLIVSRSGGGLRLNTATLDELQAMVGTLGQLKGDFAKTQSGFSGLIEMIAPGAAASPFFSETAAAAKLPNTKKSNEADAPSTEAQAPTIMAADEPSEGIALAEGLLAAVAAIPALPKLPDLARDFEELADNPIFAGLYSQLRSIDPDSVNTMIGEFKTLVQNSLEPALTRAREDGLDFILEPETLESLTKGAGSFVKTIGGMNEILDGVIGGLKELLDEAS